MPVKTRILIISDTHGKVFRVRPEHKADVVIHCGDLTDKSKLDEYHRTLQLLKDLDAPLKLVIAGNHDFSLDPLAFERKINEAMNTLEPEHFRKEHGNYGEVRRLFDEAPGVMLLDEGTHKFNLQNGASLTVYASPYTPSTRVNAFQYHPDTEHQFTIEERTDIVITHGPPLGIMDETYRGRAGCADLFAAVARVRPRLHCFGHIHGDWGAKLVAWWRKEITDTPPHFTAINQNHCVVIDTLRRITQRKRDSPRIRWSKLYRALQYTEQGYCATSCCHDDPHPLEFGFHTLFVNAAVEGISHNFPMHPPWIVDIDLPLAH
ncbi:ser/Thr protein phosphatase family protein [Xylaria sp. FL1042]|nr:ser/Thr protein phosphatase family protein [Xylaria sp. FL1042]